MGKMSELKKRESAIRGQIITYNEMLSDVQLEIMQKLVPFEKGEVLVCVKDGVKATFGGFSSIPPSKGGWEAFMIGEITKVHFPVGSPEDWRRSKI